MFYDTPAWRRVRAAVLVRDGFVCQIRGPKCKVDATQVDHIIRPEDGGGWYDLENLRGACAWCNRSRGGKVGARRTNGRFTAKRLNPSREW